MSDEITATNEQLVQSYRVCFGSPAGRVVLDDLMKFCRFRVPADGKIEEGQRRVFLRIMQFMSFDIDQLTAMYGGRLTASKEDDANG